MSESTASGSEEIQILSDAVWPNPDILGPQAAGLVRCIHTYIIRVS